MTPFRLVFGIEVVVPMEYVIPSLRLSIQHRMSPEESIFHRQMELLKLEEDQIQSAYLVEVVDRGQAWMFRLKKFYGKVPEVPKWMVNKAKEITSKRVTISVLGVAVDFFVEVPSVEFSPRIGIRSSDNGMAVENQTAESKVQIEECWRNGIGKKGQGILISGGTHFQAIIAPSTDVTNERTNFEWRARLEVNFAWRAQLESQQQEEPVEVKSDDSKSESYQGSGDTVIAAFYPNEETRVCLKRISLYEFACLPWHAWAENEFVEQQWNMIKEGKGLIAGDVRLAPKLVSKLTGKRDWHWTPAVGRVAPYLATIFEHVLKVTPAASGMKTPAADTLMKEGIGKKITLFFTGIVGSARKNVPESLLAKEGSSASHSAMGIFSVEEATNYLTNLGKFLQSQDEALRVLQNAKQEHKCSVVFDGELQKINMQLLQEKLDKEKLQEEVAKLQAEGKAMTFEILSVAEDFQQWIDGLKIAMG
ncbi:hypothetical protein L7F22_061974 [Adiantum nelumboides]|nr:hypothetical protein [Adiantum nelumboides]